MCRISLIYVMNVVYTDTINHNRIQNKTKNGIIVQLAKNKPGDKFPQACDFSEFEICRITIHTRIDEFKYKM